MTSITDRYRSNGTASRRGAIVVGPLAGSLIVCAMAAAIGIVAAEQSIVVIAALLAGVAAVAIAVNPDRATLVVVAILYSNAAAIAVQRYDVPYFAGAAFPLLLIVPFAYHVVIRRQPIIIASGLPFMLGYFVILILSLVAGMSVDPDRATDAFVTFIVEGLLIYVAMTNVVRTMGDLRLVVWVLIVTGGILGFLSVHQQATNAFDNDYGGFAQVSEAQIGADDFDQGGQPRLSGPIGEKNRYAQILVVLLPLGLFRIWGERRPELKITAGVLTLFIALGAMLTFSRGAALGFAIVIVLMTLLRYIRLSQLLAVALAAAVLFVAQPVYFERMLSLAALEGAADTAGASAQEDASIRKRANETIAALLVFADHPVLGVGRGLFPRYYGDYADEVGIISEAEDRQAHNLYTGMAAEVGLFGFLCFIAIFGVTLLDLERVRRRWKVARPDVAQMAIAFSLAVLAYLTTGMFLHLAYERYLWILLALAASAAWIGLHATEPNEAEEVEDQTTAARPPGPVPGKVRRAAKPA